MTPCETFLDTLRGKGYRITPQREMIVRAIAHSGCHMTAEEVLAEVQQHTRAINLATIYRNLDLLVAEGLATRIDIGKNQVVYATLNHGPHIHLVCRNCGQVIDADPQLLAPIAEQVQREHAFAADLNHIAIYGLCESCQQRK